MSKNKNPKVVELLEAKKQYDKMIKGLGSEIASEILKPYFETTGATALRFHGYTPGFNDGDACTFTLGEVSAQLEEDGDFHDGWSVSYDKLPNGKKIEAELDKATAEIHELEDVMERLYNGYEFTIYANGKTTTEDYDCGF